MAFVTDVTNPPDALRMAGSRYPRLSVVGVVTDPLNVRLTTFGATCTASTTVAEPTVYAGMPLSDTGWSNVSDSDGPMADELVIRIGVAPSPPPDIRRAG